MWIKDLNNNVKSSRRFSVSQQKCNLSVWTWIELCLCLFFIWITFYSNISYSIYILIIIITIIVRWYFTNSLQLLRNFWRIPKRSISTYNCICYWVFFIYQIYIYIYRCKPNIFWTIPNLIKLNIIIILCFFFFQSLSLMVII